MRVEATVVPPPAQFAALSGSYQLMLAGAIGSTGLTTPPRWPRGNRTGVDFMFTSSTGHFSTRNAPAVTQMLVGPDVARCAPNLERMHLKIPFTGTKTRSATVEKTDLVGIRSV